MLRFAKALIFILVPAGAVSALPSQDSSATERMAAEEVQSLRWLRSEILPNALFPTPHPQRRGLILSYSPDPGQSGPTFNKSYAYDAGIAAVALSAAGDWDNAARILDALVRVQRENGSFWFSYSAVSGWPEQGDHDMAVVRTGATAWAGYGFAYYLLNRPEFETAVLHRQKQRFLTAASKAADFILSLQILDSTAAKGLVRGGQAVVRLAVGKDGKVAEVYVDQPIRWVSTEHNLSSFFFLSACHRLTGNPRYAAAAAEIRGRLLSALWQESMGQFATGFKEDGQINRNPALDCASWGALFLYAVGEKAKAEIALQTADKLFLNRHSGVDGYRPYYSDPIYDDPLVQRLMLPEYADSTWKDIDLVWSEGSLGVALAQLRIGNAERARKIVNEMYKMKSGDGIRYATRSLPYLFAGSASVAGTAWAVILEEAFKDPRVKGFWLP